MPRQPSKIKVPGETSSPEEVGADSAQQVSTAVDKVTVSKASLDALLARVAALESQPRSAAKKPNQSANLPDAESIDIATLKNPVLTKQGWLVPENYGSNPNAPKAI